jgi:hypothetical protein
MMLKVIIPFILFAVVMGLWARKAFKDTKRFKEGINTSFEKYQDND